MLHVICLVLNLNVGGECMSNSAIRSRPDAPCDE